MNLLDLARVLRAAADEAERIDAEQAEERSGWHDQHDSQLGRRRHCARVRARLEAGQSGAGIAGRRFLLDDQAYAEELASFKRRKPMESTELGVRLRKRLGLVA